MGNVEKQNKKQKLQKLFFLFHQLGAVRKSAGQKRLKLCDID